MENKNSNFWIGLGIGSVIDTFQKIGGQAEDILDLGKEKVLDTGVAVADKVTDKTLDLAEKAGELKNKMHTKAAEAKK